MSRVRESVYPTRHTNAERIWVSSGLFPLHILYMKDIFKLFGGSK